MTSPVLYTYSSVTAHGCPSYLLRTLLLSQLVIRSVCLCLRTLLLARPFVHSALTAHVPRYGHSTKAVAALSTSTLLPSRRPGWRCSQLVPQTRCPSIDRSCVRRFVNAHHERSFIVHSRACRRTRRHAFITAWFNGSTRESCFARWRLRFDASLSDRGSITSALENDERIVSSPRRNTWE